MPVENTGHKKDATIESSSRWWDFYFVRYAIGTVIGTIVVKLLCPAGSTLSQLLFADDKMTGWARLAIYAAYGLVYCYLASAPILVFHAARFNLNPDAHLCRKLCWLVVYLVGPVAAATVIYFQPDSDSSLAAEVKAKIASFSVSSFVMALVLWPQIVLIFRTIWDNKKLYNFYKTLTSHRKVAKENFGGEIIESYRHLREHGNSFFILFLEVMLAVILYGVQAFAVRFPSASENVKLAFPLMIITLWILPAVFVWLIATLFEYRFSEDPDFASTSAPRSGPAAQAGGSRVE